MRYYRILVSLLLCIVVLMMSSCVTYTTFDELTTKNSESATSYEYITSSGEETTAYIAAESTTSAVLPEQTTVVDIIIPETTTAAPVIPEQTTATPVVPDTTVSVPAPDFSSYTKKQIIDTYAEALNKTRGYTGALTVDHTESFDADIKDAHPGGALTELLANNIVKLVGSEGQQTLNFNAGKATNADEEVVPILLPQRTEFSLPEEGVATASIAKSGDKTNIKIVLVPETVSMGQVPTYNANAIGYLDTSDMSFSIITISRVDITYPGSVIEAVIRSDGYIESVTYTINMSTYAELSGMGISGYGTLEGAQTEKWQLNW